MVDVVHNLNEPCYVYIIAHCDAGGPVGPIKVGITRNLASRLASLQTGNWRRIEIAHFFTMPSRTAALQVEAAFHNRYRELNMAGEWFGFDDVREAFDYLCDIVWTHIEQRFEGEARETLLNRSGARNALRDIAKDWEQSQ